MRRPPSGDNSDFREAVPLMAGQDKDSPRHSEGHAEAGDNGPHAHVHDHAHGHGLQADPDHIHFNEAGHAYIRHSYLEPRPFASRSSIRPQPLSDLPPKLAEHFGKIVARNEKAFAEPFVGVTTDGTVMPDLFRLGTTGITLQPVVDAAGAFLATLSPDERQTASFPVESIEWRKWSNAHANHFRHGVCMHYMSEDQRRAALDLLAATTSASGYQAMRDVMRLNEHVLELTGRPDEYGEWHYFVSIFGEPSTEKPWGWQLDGHHLIVNCMMFGDQMVMTPTFLGSEPCFAESGKFKGLRVLEAEESLGHDLMSALAPEQQAQATIGDVLPKQMFAVAPWDNRVIEHLGIPFDALDSEQKERLYALIETYTGRMRPGHAEIEFKTVKRYLDQTKFAWIGRCDDTSPFYYRVHSPVILIEFDHQDGVAFKGDEPTRSHIHTVIRTPNGNDYGRDLLRQHYEQYEHTDAGRHRPRDAEERADD